jgi:hypothetical protein
MLGLPSPYLILAGVAFSALLAAGSAYEGYHYKSLQDQAAIAAAENQVIDRIGKADAVTETVSQADQAAVQQIQSATQTLIMKVPVYVTQKASARCVINRGFVRLHDGAVAGSAIPLAPGQSDDDPARVDLPAVGATIAANYGTYAVVRQQLIDLQNWVRDQQALAGGKPPQGVTQ